MLLVMADRPAPTKDSGFTEEQRSELATLIAEAVGGAKPPAPEEQPSNVPQVSDDEWASMSDKSRQGYIESVVSHMLSELAHLDADQRRDAQIADLANQKPEPERPPSIVSKLQKLLWGDPDER